MVLALVLALTMLTACGAMRLKGTWKVTNITGDVDEIDFGGLLSLQMINSGLVELSLTFSNNSMTVTTSMFGVRESEDFPCKVTGNKIIIDGEAANYKINGSKLTIDGGGIVITLERQD